jgi:osmotically-inducible protein OsmY
MLNRALSACFAAAALVSPAALGATKPVIPAPLEDQVRHQLRMLPYYNVFEELTYRVDGGVVTLSGQVTRPTLSRDAENAVRRLPAVTRVNNRIEVLPLSPYDSRLRLQAYAAIYGFAPLQRYGAGTQPSIRILVKNGNVTLAGVVDSETGRNLAYLRANSLPGVFTVSNDLRVAHGAAR